MLSETVRETGIRFFLALGIESKALYMATHKLLLSYYKVKADFICEWNTSNTK